MSEDQAEETANAEEPAAEEAQPKKRKRWRFFPSSPQGKGAFWIALFLVLLVAIVWTVFMLDADNVPWRHSMSWTRLLLQLLLVIVIPVFAYFTIASWLQAEKSQYPDIDYAWQAGLDALEENGMSLLDAPLFLIVGSEGEQLERAVMAATDLDLRVSGVPEGPAPLHWYANPDGIYLVTSDASWHSALAHSYVAYQEQQALENEQAAEESRLADDISASPPAAGTQPAAIASSHGPTGTITLNQFVDPAESTSAPAEEFAAAPSSTIQSSGGSWLHETARVTPQRAAKSSTAGLEEDRPSLLTSSDVTAQTRRLNHLCEKIRRTRQPICGINGILVLLPFEMLQEGTWTQELMQTSIRGDLRTIQASLQLLSPVMLLVTGMEKERGFRELVRRVGRNRASNQRFGSRFAINTVPIAGEVRKFANHVCGAFEDWVYTLFREQQVLMRPGNTKLFGLLCKVRSTLKNQLGELLAGSVGYQPGGYTEEVPQLFSGCYFAATGKTHDRQAFVKAVFTKMLDSQEEVQWTSAARRESNLVKWLVLAGRVTAGALVAILLGMVIWDFFIR